MNIERPIVIVGTGLAGYTLAREIRKLDKETPILMITSDDGHAYSKPMLSTALTKNKTAQALSMGDAGRMASQLNLEIRTFTPVTGLDTAHHLVFIGDESVRYQKLVLAWGADVVRPHLNGNALDQVFSINDLQDYRRFREALENKHRVLIMGAGLIGCEFANDLLSLDCDLDVVAPSTQVMPSLLPAPCAAAVQAALEEKGVRFHLGQTVTEVNRVDHGVAALLDNGDVVHTDLVISAIGLKPRTALVESELACGEGIKVNRALETSAPDVYALGDCAEVDGKVSLYVAPLMACARALAKTITGTRTEVRYGPMPVIVKTTVCPVAVLVPEPGVDGQWEEVYRSGADIKMHFLTKEGRLAGFALTGACVEERQALTRQVEATRSETEG